QWALAPQTTLQTVRAGGSLIFDQAVRIGDYMKVGDLEGTVEHIGLRSTRIRTLNRTIVTIPNSQIANMSLETFSARDKFWFHPVVGLRYETTEDQMGLVLRGLRDLLDRHDRADRTSCAVCAICSNATAAWIGHGCGSASCASALSDWTSSCSPTSMPATGRIFWRFRRACCSGSRRSFTRQGRTSPFQRKRCTW